MGARLNDTGTAPHGAWHTHTYAQPTEQEPRRDEAASGIVPHGWRTRAWWPWIKHGASLAFFAAVLWLVARYARTLDWDDVLESITSTPRPTLLMAIGIAIASHVLYSCFDLIGRRYTGHTLRTGLVMAVSFVSYAFNLCIGSIVGGVGFRYRMYSQLGLGTGVITRIVSMSMLTNWLGYKLLAGVLFMVRPLALPPSWKMGNSGLLWVGAVLVFISVSYIVACVRLGDRTWTVKGHELYLPPWRMAVLQMAISCINWCLMAAIIWVLLGQALPYTDVLTVLLIGAIAGVVAHVPAGLGVFEFVFVALLSHRVPETHLIAALLGYRALYYIGPLAIASLVYLWIEIHAKRTAQAREVRIAGAQPANEGA